MWTHGAFDSSGIHLDGRTQAAQPGRLVILLTELRGDARFSRYPLVMTNISMENHNV